MGPSELVLIASGAARAFDLAPGRKPITIGRSSECDLYLGSSSVSRRHAEIVLGDRGPEVRDLRSGNGTFVNGRRVSSAPLASGDTLRVGDVSLRVELRAPGAGSSDLRCQTCGRLITMATLKDGQAFEWSARVLCPACREGEAAAARPTSERQLADVMGREGFKVIARLSREAATVPLYKARRMGLGDLVAIKVLALESVTDPTQVERFKTEARAMAQLKHPNVVQIYDVRASTEALLIVMEFVEGETLLERIERVGRLPPHEAVAIATALARALEAAAAQGIVHRNVKPGNVLLSGRDGSAKLADFGLAKDVGKVGLTAQHGLLGTIRYMSPEQARDSSTADARSDIYALGATLFHALTGVLPHASIPEVEILKHVARGSLPALDLSVHSDIPAAVAPVLGRMLDPDPARRPRTATELLAELAHAAAYVPGRPGPITGDVLATQKLSAPVPGAMAGAFEGDQLTELVQMLGIRSTGILTVAVTGGEGYLAFLEGKVVAAWSHAGARGEEVAIRILSTPRGTFQFTPGLPADLGIEQALDVRGLLLEAVRRRDEGSGVRRKPLA